MKRNPVVRDAVGRFNENELIFANKLYKEKLSFQIKEDAYYKTLQRMCEAGELVKIAKGTYHLPKYSKYGIVPPSEKEIISAFTDNESGTVIGYSMYNELGLTTQIAKSVEILSSVPESFTKTIRNVVVHKVPLLYSPEIVDMIRGLEVLQNFYTIQDLDYPAFIAYTEKLAKTFNADAFKEVISVKKYKKSTISFLREILNHYNVPNNLDEYLSSLSEYKHPTMEELHESART